MALIKIGELITISNEKNTNGKDLPFYGININKEFMPTVANTQGIDGSKYKIIKKNRFVFSGMQTGRDGCIRIGLYEEDNEILISPAYTTFEVTSPLILPEYLFMIFKSKEMDRFGAFLSDSSVRANLDWERFIDIEIDLPNLEIQKKYVDIYKGLKHNLKVYQSKLDDLKMVCDAYIENLRRENIIQPLKMYIKECVEKNSNNEIKEVMGLSVNKEFRKPHATVNTKELSNYKIVRPKEFAFVPTTDTWKVFAFSVNNFDKDIVVSPIYVVFEVDNTRLMSDYLAMWFKRKEFDRYARFNSWGSARENYSFDDLCEFKIPVPELEVQKSIVDIYKAYEKRKKYVDKLKDKINNICPILIRGAVKEAKNG